MILPIGHQEREVRRLPWVTLALGIPSEPGEQPAFQRFGLVPAHLSARSFATHMFLHAGWFHLIGNLFMLLLAGPPIEDRYGRALFAGFYALAGVFAALLYTA